MLDDKSLLMEMLRRMVRIRFFEERVIQMVERGEIVGAAHSYIGEEAVAVGACLALRDDDWMTGNHRSHGHPIAKGGDVKRAMAELLGKATGFCKGKGGSMHLADFSIGILGESGILGSAIPTAVGAALGSKLQGNDRVAVPFFGDGASNEGAFHESINLAAIWKLPVIFLCENNQYAVSSSFKKMVASENISDRAASYNIPGVLVDGQDVIAMYEAVSVAVARARAGDGPSLIEGLTYRYHDHSLGLNRIVRAPYRDEEEVEQWKARDPIKIHKELLLSQDIATQAEIDQLEQEVMQQIDEAVEFARESPYPEPSALFEDMYANPIPLE
ncbi:MAG: thiamine pyrophosphate-dependent dehydrogenase E1 component subunit alpha [Chloroflexi bacterium]|nr:thiamine pyrophosphate-dependent dehydrogenase E1 component subunit alpha [Chloroflexota bacterium]MCI0786966.1 thiamine pyrophosphate-dependent dehydrogenase E1 component subunit alpha [Chloroflexota bacterium]MCI0866186.1 thiamine pyrophosphate-dependent dehydrogenase E1 component subunit alpha [Chloroflexota bacterium]